MKKATYYVDYEVKVKFRIAVKLDAESIYDVPQRLEAQRIADDKVKGFTSEKWSDMIHDTYHHTTINRQVSRNWFAD